MNGDQNYQGLGSGAAHGCGGWPYQQNYPYYNQPQQSIPSHITHSWSMGSMGGLGGDPFGGLTAAMNRLAEALEKFNERK